MGDIMGNIGNNSSEVDSSGWMGGQLSSMGDSVETASANVASYENLSTMNIEDMLDMEGALEEETIDVEALASSMNALYSMGKATVQQYPS